MRKQKVVLNKFERMLLESKFPTLRILLEKDEGLDDLFGNEDSNEKSKEDDNNKEEESKGEEGGDEGLDDLFGDTGEEEKSEEESSKGEEDDGKDQEEDNGKDQEESSVEKDDKKQKEQEAIEKAAATATEVLKNVAGGVIEPGDDDAFTNALFGNRSAEMSNSNIQVSHQIRKQRNRINENISKYLFRNISMKQISHKKNLSLSNFHMNEKKFLRLNNVINEATSVDEIINNKFWEENATVDLIVDNAINLTRHFEDLIDIPKLIMNSVAIKFGKQAALESSENKGAENEYKLKLDEFLQKYSTALKQLPDYENYDTSRNVFDASKPDHAATGAFNPGG